jgi:predicted lipoprotein with Yx(FWY)xxD motif
MRRITLSLVALAGFGTAALTGLAQAGTKHPTLVVEKNVKDVAQGNKLVNVVGTPRGLPLYYLTGDSKKHPECTSTNGCFSIWIPFKVKSKNVKLTKATGIKGKLSLWHRNGFFQVLLAKRPLYTYFQDTKGSHVANGDLIMSFGGTWHLIPDPPAGSGTTSTTSTPTTTTNTTPTTPYW